MSTISTAWVVECKRCPARSFFKYKREAEQAARSHDKDMHDGKHD